jgi:predicted naringenin-chalcone synthase
MNPTLHTVDQLVIQSLFADGCIKYSLGEKKQSSPCLKILAVSEEIVEKSTEKMTWNVHDWGFQMWISKDIPFLLRNHLEGFLERLSEKGGGMDIKNARFAIHPGGPKIVEQISEMLGLAPHQFEHSKYVLQNYGNMSSATLPHIWDKMLKDDTVQIGEKIVSLAFGPGLTMSGIILEKCR